MLFWAIVATLLPLFAAFHSGHRNESVKNNKYLLHLLAEGHLIAPESSIGVGLNYDKSLLSPEKNHNKTTDADAAFCDLYTIHPFITWHSYKQCLRTYKWELISRIIKDSGAYGYGPMDGCNFLMYLWGSAMNSHHHGVFLDVGGNIGTCSFMFAANGINAVAFEMIPANYVVFAKTIVGNDPLFTDMILLYPYGVGDVEVRGAVAYYQNDNMGNSMLSRPVPTHKRDKMIKENVDIRKLDDVMWPKRLLGGPPPNIPVMKLDVQGFEYKALLGARELLKAGAIKIIAYENEKAQLQNQGNTCTEIGTLLAEYGYRVYDSNFREVPDPTMCEDLPIGDMFAKLWID